MRQVATQSFAALVQVTHFWRVVSGFVKRNVGQLAVWNRDIKTIAEGLDVFVRQLFGLVNVVLTFTDFAHAKTLDGLDEQHRRLVFVFDGLGKCGIDFFAVVTAAAQVKNFFVAHVRDHLQSLGVLAKEVFANIRAVVGLHGLIVTIQRVHHDFFQDAVFVACEQGVPAGAPEQLDDVPACASEFTFELLHNFAVATHWAVEALQVAVDDEDQVVELFTGGQADGAEGFNLVHLAVTTKHPDLAVLGIGNAACVQVL